LEGETSTSKTSSILFLAAWLNQPVVRLNLNGQTDTGELIGRYVPREQTQGENGEQGSIGLGWRWQDGLIVQAMKRGWWVVLDEVNLAEPQILERLNSVLEREPTLVMSEHDNTLFGSGGRPIHPDFRIFATMNPAEYAGRSELSPAYRDRWLGYRFVPAPDESAYRSMLHFLVHGRQPDVTVLGRRYRGQQSTPLLGALTSMSHIDAFLDALARFHSAVEQATRRGQSGRRQLGRHRRERYIFTRRSLLGVVEYLARAIGVMDTQSGTRVMRGALLRYYLARIANAEDRATVVQLLNAAGLGPETWSLRETRSHATPERV